jgi:hypothetical protein
MDADVDKVFKALADPGRRLLLDRLYAENGQTLGRLCDHLDMTRQAVTKHPHELLPPLTNRPAVSRQILSGGADNSPFPDQRAGAFVSRRCRPSRARRRAANVATLVR